jgi:hypothetical protein
LTEVTLIALKREQKAAKCITHTAKTVARGYSEEGSKGK